ncbi:hypothetical protein RFI_20778 [Reticulomyxa filosa]|uniref:Uncharacterized protein n=1 Tax=Reticulomyxa filosa TaxID=46433 RepID=X6MSY5_RETFI|nr:hypothetical protein RFI_20778 [Reticulomyxa filosa]|eukprot:ETO16562.1 hypothetical protein RFI_20778 [Reticulomyxa filosa]
MTTKIKNKTKNNQTNNNKNFVFKNYNTLYFFNIFIKYFDENKFTQNILINHMYCTNFALLLKYNKWQYSEKQATNIFFLGFNLSLVEIYFEENVRQMLPKDYIYFFALNLKHFITNYTYKIIHKL